MTCFLTALLPAGTEALELCGKPAQGEILKGYAPGAEKILLDGREYMLSPSGNFLLAFGRDETPEKKLTVINARGAAKDYSLNVTATKWDIQDIKGIPQKKVTPSAADQKEIGRERGEKSPGRQTKQKLLGKRLCYTGQGTYQRPFRGPADNERQKDEPASGHRYRRSGRNPGQSRVKRHCPVKRRQLLLLRQHCRHRPRPPAVYHLRASEKSFRQTGRLCQTGTGHRRSRQNRTRYRPAPALGSVAQRRALHARIIITYE